MDSPSFKVPLIEGPIFSVITTSAVNAVVPPNSETKIEFEAEEKVEFIPAEPELQLKDPNEHSSGEVYGKSDILQGPPTPVSEPSHNKK